MSWLPITSGERGAPTSGPADAQPPNAVSLEPTARARCYRCFRPQALCYCADVPQIDNETPIIILQHPRERFHPIGTARLAALSLKRCEIIVNSDSRFAREPLPLPQGAGLLFPDAHALPLSRLPPSARPSALVVLDGTWHHAKTLFRDIDALRSLPRYAFVPPRPSRYRLRKEPRSDFVSTIEAIAYALTALEPQTPGLDRLLDVFELMINRQIEAQPTALEGRKRKAARPTALRRLPRAFAEDFSRVVVAYGEGIRVPTEMGGSRGARRLVHWVARRLRDGAAFDALLADGVQCGGDRLRYLGLSQSDRANALSHQTFQNAWQSFLHPDDILVGWNQGTLELLDDVAPWRGSLAYLKAAYHAVQTVPPEHAGAPEDLVAFERLTLESSAVRGRAGLRLANAEALTRFLAKRV